MTYKELIEKALNGRSVNKAAKEIGLRQVYLNRYKNNKSLPNYCDALILAKEAGINAAEAFEIFAEEERTRKEQKGKKFPNLLSRSSNG